MGYTELEDIGEENTMLKEQVHKFAEEVIKPASMKLDRMEAPKVAEKGSLYWDVFRQMKELGFHKVWVPRKYGGLEFNPDQLSILYEELGWGSVGLATAIGVDCLPPTVISMVGSPEAIEEILIPWMKDEEGKYHGCWAVTEPEHGSDWLLAPSYPAPTEFGKGQVSAVKDGDGWLINGSKSQWVSSAPVATHALVHVVFAEKDFSMAEGGMALVPLDLPGVIKGVLVDKHGLRDDPQGEIVFDNVRIPESHIVLAAPEFYTIFIDQLFASTSSFMATAFTGLARAAFEEAYKYARERTQGGKPLIEHEAIKLTLYGMFERVETSRAYARKVMRHVWERLIKEQTYDASVAHALAAQVFCKRAAFAVAHEAVQIFGGYGLSKDFWVEKLFRDARAGMVEDGTLEVLSLAAAYELDKSYQI